MTALLSGSQIGYFERRIDTTADVLALVVSSDEMLELIRTNGPDHLKRDWTVRTQLDWVRTGSGERKYGIEIVPNGRGGLDNLKQDGRGNTASERSKGATTQGIGGRSPATPPPSFFTTIQGQRHGYEIVTDGDEGLRRQENFSRHSSVGGEVYPRPRSGE